MTRIRRLYFKPDYSASPDFFVGPIGLFEIWRSAKMLCESFNILYLLECQQNSQRYVGTTGRQLKHKLEEHKGYINNQVLVKAIGEHFNLSGA